MKAAVVDPDKRHKLIVVVLDEKNVAIAHFKFRSVGHFHCLVANGAAEDSDCVRGTCITFHILPDLKRDIRVDVSLGALAFPYRTHVGHRSLENKFGLLN